ncbi:MAG: SCO family protein [Gammaproteobacteria bacterium]|nr:SCO family protein [Gammaproteobacteria bacterium]
MNDCLRIPLFVAILLLAACDEGEPWRTRDISGLMPELEFRLIDDRGQPVTADAFDGRVNLLYFGFTHCPDICPATLGKLVRARSELPDGLGKNVRILFVSVDPQRDDPQSLRTWTGYFGDDVVGLTGDREALDALTRRYRVTYGYGEETEPGRYDVSHSSAVFAFDPEGEARLLLRKDDPVAAISADLERLLREG